MKNEIKRCPRILSKLRKDLNREREEFTFEQEQSAKRFAGAERIRKHAQELGVKLYEDGVTK